MSGALTAENERERLTLLALREGGASGAMRYLCTQITDGPVGAIDIAMEQLRGEVEARRRATRANLIEFPKIKRPTRRALAHICAGKDGAA